MLKFVSILVLIRESVATFHLLRHSIGASPCISWRGLRRTNLTGFSHVFTCTASSALHVLARIVTQLFGVHLLLTMLLVLQLLVLHHAAVVLIERLVILVWEKLLL